MLISTVKLVYNNVRLKYKLNWLMIHLAITKLMYAWINAQFHCMDGQLHMYALVYALILTMKILLIIDVINALINVLLAIILNCV